MGNRDVKFSESNDTSGILFFEIMIIFVIIANYNEIITVDNLSNFDITDYVKYFLIFALLSGLTAYIITIVPIIFWIFNFTISGVVFFGVSYMFDFSEDAMVWAAIAGAICFVIHLGSYRSLVATQINRIK